MSTVSEQLQLAREAKNLTIEQVAEITKIRTDHIRALEGGNFEVFSAPVYIRGSIRAYAALLKLDAPKLIEALDAELGKNDKFREATSHNNPSRGVLDFITLQLSKLNWRSAVAIVVAIAALAVTASGVVYWRHRQADPLAHFAPGVYQAPQSGEILPLPPVPQHK